MEQDEQKPILTKREAEVLKQLASGALYKEIAATSSISIETVKKHTKNIYKKLSARNRTEAVNFFTKEMKKEQFMIFLTPSLLHILASIQI